MIEMANAGHLDEVEFIEGPPDREDGCHLFDMAAPFYCRKFSDHRHEMAAFFWRMYEVVEVSHTAPVYWVRRRYGFSPAPRWESAYEQAAQLRSSAATDGEGER